MLTNTFKNKNVFLNNKVFNLEHLAIFIAGITLIYVLMIKPIIGVADNGDFGRIMGMTGLDYTSSDRQDRYFGYMNRTYITTPSGDLQSGYFSSEIFVVKVAKLMNNLVFRGGNTFDIRFLALLYALLLLGAIYLMIRFTKSKINWASWLLLILLLLVFTDVGYISYFNSLYGEALSLTSLLLTIAFALCFKVYPLSRTFWVFSIPII